MDVCCQEYKAGRKERKEERKGWKGRGILTKKKGKDEGESRRKEFEVRWKEEKRKKERARGGKRNEMMGQQIMEIKKNKYEVNGKKQGNRKRKYGIWENGEGRSEMKEVK